MQFSPGSCEFIDTDGDRIRFVQQRDRVQECVNGSVEIDNLTDVWYSRCSRLLMDVEGSLTIPDEVQSDAVTLRGMLEAAGVRWHESDSIVYTDEEGDQIGLESWSTRAEHAAFVAHSEAAALSTSLLEDFGGPGLVTTDVHVFDPVAVRSPARAPSCARTHTHPHAHGRAHTSVAQIQNLQREFPTVEHAVIKAVYEKCAPALRAMDACRGCVHRFLYGPVRLHAFACAHSHAVVYAYARAPAFSALFVLSIRTALHCHLVQPAQGLVSDTLLQPFVSCLALLQTAIRRHHNHGGKARRELKKTGGKPAVVCTRGVDKKINKFVNGIFKHAVTEAARRRIHH